MPSQSCPKRVTHQSGIICANVGVTRGRFPKCEHDWCAECVIPSHLDPKVIKLPVDFMGANINEVGDHRRFMVARPGDHVVTSFQCPNCQCQNIRGENLDTIIMAGACFESLCIRATLDAFWARSENTVCDHL